MNRTEYVLADYIRVETCQISWNAAYPYFITLQTDGRLK